MYSKADIFNLALGALLLSRQISDTDNDKSNESKVLNTHWAAALRTTLSDLDLDAVASQATLELIELNPNNLWNFSYKYPANCAFFRRIQSPNVQDNRDSHRPKRISNKDGIKVIFTNEEDAIGEFIPFDVPLSILSSPAALAVAFRLAWLSAPLVVGKGSIQIRKEILEKYISTKAEAKELDRLENFNFSEPDIESEFVAARIE